MLHPRPFWCGGKGSASQFRLSLQQQNEVLSPIQTGLTVRGFLCETTLQHYSLHLNMLHALFIYLQQAARVETAVSPISMSELYPPAASEGHDKERCGPWYQWPMLSCWGAIVCEGSCSLRNTTSVQKHIQFCLGKARGGICDRKGGGFLASLCTENRQS